MQESFSILDRDRSGVLDVQNIADSMKALGVDKKTDEIHAMVKVCVCVFVCVCKCECMVKVDVCVGVCVGVCRSHESALCRYQDLR